MAIGVIFDFGGEIIEVRIEGNTCFFRNKQFGGMFSPLEGLKLDYRGVCREFPDLETKDNWREEAIKRFKDKIKNMKTEKERMEYIINDLKKFGYVPLYMQEDGQRTKKL